LVQNIVFQLVKWTNPYENRICTRFNQRAIFGNLNNIAQNEHFWGFFHRTPKPWEKAIRQNQREAKAAWLEAADELDKQATPENTTLAKRMRHYVEYGMPKPETAADKLKKAIRAEQDKGIER
jgi:hypothetical protein